MLARGAAVVCTALFVSLGLWQLERAQEKLQRIELQRARMQQPPLALGATVLDGAALHFAPVVIEGVFEAWPQVLIDNVIRDGVPGYEVITPFRPHRSEVRVWVNRGWLPWGGDRTALPAAPIPKGAWRLGGHAWPAAGGRLQLGAGGCCTAPPPGPWLDLDLGALRALAPWPAQPFVVRLDPGAPPDGMVRDGARAAVPGEYWVHRHRAYALQWFGLAVMVPVLWITIALRRRKAARRSKAAPPPATSR